MGFTQDTAYHTVVPTRVGVNRWACLARTRWTGRPHTRGGEPIMDVSKEAIARSSPHAWG